MVFRINRKQQQVIQIKLKEKNALSSDNKSWMDLTPDERGDITRLGSISQRESGNLSVFDSNFTPKSLPDNLVGKRFSEGLVKLRDVPTVEELKKEKLEEIEKNKKFIEQSKKDVLEATNEKLQRFLSLPLDDFQRKLVNDEIARRS